MRSSVVRFFMSIFPVLLLVLLLRFSIYNGSLSIADDLYDWRLPSSTALIQRFLVFNNIRDDFVKHINWIMTSLEEANLTYNSFPAIVSWKSFWQAVGQFFVMFGQIFKAIGQTFVVLFDVVITPARAVYYFLYVILA